MLAMIVPMAAFADANVPTAKDVYSSAGGFVTFDVSLVPGDYTIAAKPTKNETVKVMVDGKEVSTFTVKKEGNVKIQATVDEKTEFESAFVLTLNFDFEKALAATQRELSDVLLKISSSSDSKIQELATTGAGIQSDINKLAKPADKDAYDTYVKNHLYLGADSPELKEISKRISTLDSQVDAAKNNLAGYNLAVQAVKDFEASAAWTNLVAEISNPDISAYAAETKGCKAKYDELNAAVKAEKEAIEKAYKDGTAGTYTAAVMTSWVEKNKATAESITKVIQKANTDDKAYNVVLPAIKKAIELRNEMSNKLVTALPADPDVYGDMLTEAQNKLNEQYQKVILLNGVDKNGTATSHDNAAATQAANENVLTAVTIAINALQVDYIDKAATLKADYASELNKVNTLQTSLNNATSDADAKTKLAKDITAIQKMVDNLKTTVESDNKAHTVKAGKYDTTINEINDKIGALKTAAAPYESNTKAKAEVEKDIKTLTESLSAAKTAVGKLASAQDKNFNIAAKYTVTAENLAKAIAGYTAELDKQYQAGVKDGKNAAGAYQTGDFATGKAATSKAIAGYQTDATNALAAYDKVVAALASYNTAVADLEKTAVDGTVTVTDAEGAETYATAIAGLKAKVSDIQKAFDAAKAKNDAEFTKGIAAISLDGTIVTQANNLKNTYADRKSNFDTNKTLNAAIAMRTQASKRIDAVIKSLEAEGTDYKAETYGKKNTELSATKTKIVDDAKAKKTEVDGTSIDEKNAANVIATILPKLNEDIKKLEDRKTALGETAAKYEKAYTAEKNQNAAATTELAGLKKDLQAASAKNEDPARTAEFDGASISSTITTIETDIATSFGNETLVSDWSDAKNEKGEVTKKGYATQLAAVKTSISELSKKAEASTVNWKANTEINAAWTTYDVAKKIASVETAINTVAASAASMTHYTSEYAELTTEKSNIESAITKAYGTDRDAAAKKTALIQRISTLAGNLQTLATNIPVNEASYAALTKQSDAVQTAWNEAYAKIAANDASTKKDHWLKQLSEQDVTFGIINKDIADSYKKGGLLAEKRAELETSLANVNKAVKDIVDQQEAGYNAAIAADNQTKYNAFLNAAELAQSAITSANKTIVGYRDVSHEDLKSDCYNDILTTLDNISKYQGLLDALKTETETKYNAVKAPALYDATSAISEADKFKADVEAAISNLSTQVRTNADKVYKAKFIDGFKKSVETTKSAAEGVVYTKKYVASAFSDLTKKVSEIEALASDDVQFLINMDTKILATIEAAEAGNEVTKALDKALTDDYTVKLNALESDIQKKQTAMAGFVHADKAKDIKAFDDMVAKTVTAAKTEKAKVGLLDATEYGAIKKLFAAYEADKTYANAETASKTAKDNDAARTDITGKIVQLNTDLAAAQTYIDKYVLVAADMKTDVEKQKAAIDKVEKDLAADVAVSANKKTYEASVKACADGVKALYASVNTKEELAIKTNITSISTELTDMKTEYAGNTAKIAEFDAYFNTNCKTLTADYEKALKAATTDTDKQAVNLDWEVKVAKAHAGLTSLWKSNIASDTYDLLNKAYVDAKAEYDALAAFINAAHAQVQAEYADQVAKLGVELVAVKSDIEADKTNNVVVTYEKVRKSAINKVKEATAAIKAPAEAKENKWKANDTAKAAIDSKNTLSSDLETVKTAVFALSHAKVEAEKVAYEKTVKAITDRITTLNSDIATANATIESGKSIAELQSSLETECTSIADDISALNKNAHYTETTTVLIKSLTDKVTLLTGTDSKVNADKKKELKKMDEEGGSIYALRSYNNNMYSAGAYDHDINGSLIKDKDNKPVSVVKDYVSEVYPEVQEKVETIIGELNHVEMIANIVLGDADQDANHLVTVNDYSEVRSWILSAKTYADVPEANAVAGDVNGDKKFTVADLTKISNIVFYGNPDGEEGTTTKARALNSNPIASVDDVITVNKTSEETTVFGKTVQIAIEVAHQQTLTAGQFDVKLPEGMKLVGQELTDRANGHELLSNEIADGQYRFVASTIDNNAFNGNTGSIVVLNVEVDGSYQGGAIEVSNAIFSDAKGRSYSITRGIGDGTGETTGIDNITAPTMKERIYSIGGMVKKSIQKGINIIVGEDGTARKVVKK